MIGVLLVDVTEEVHCFHNEYLRGLLMNNAGFCGDVDLNETLSSDSIQEVTYMFEKLGTLHETFGETRSDSSKSLVRCFEGMVDNSQQMSKEHAVLRWSDGLPCRVNELESGWRR